LRHLLREKYGAGLLEPFEFRVPRIPSHRRVVDRRFGMGNAIESALRHRRRRVDDGPGHGCGDFFRPRLSEQRAAGYAGVPHRVRRLDESVGADGGDNLSLARCLCAKSRKGDASVAARRESFVGMRGPVRARREVDAPAREIAPGHPF
jgi:hypothetical protein